MKISDFFYKLPQSLIAQKPLEQRDHSKLMIVDRKTGKLEHNSFFEIPKFLTENDVLVLNNTKVIPARFFVRKVTGGKVELLILKRIDALVFEVLLGGGKNLQINDKLILPDEDRTCTLLKKGQRGKWIVEFDFQSSLEFVNYAEKFGITPTPPYIKRDEPNKEDRTRYQTVYAEHEGSCAAPTAGLHFTDQLLKKLKDKGVTILYLQLHVGLGTFLPVKCENVNDHVMEPEYVEISEDTVFALNKAKKMGKRIIAVGSTTTRALETASESGMIKSYKGETNLFVLPGYEFRFVDSMITNFHLPDSTLILLVSAFAGKDLIAKSYKQAIDHNYRFYSYGDAMFIK